MWPNGDFASPVGSFQEPVPVPSVDPLTGDCAIIRINPAWLPYIRGALSQLWLQTTWDTDAAGLLIVQQQVTNLIFAFNDLQKGDCNGTIPEAIAESEFELSICEQLRYEGGKLQGLCCGVWEDIPGQASQGNVTTTQPGAGSPLPAPNGGTDQYCGAMGATEWLLPVPVSSGDTLLFSQLGGAWKDSSDPLVWECPNGWNYALGDCFERSPRGSPDPLPTALHMQIIALIAGNYYDVLQIDSSGTPTQFTVPSGIANENVVLLANINDIARVNGEVSFCVDVTNNAQGTWSSTLDFLTVDGMPPVVADVGTWFSGTGWEGETNGAVAHYAQLHIDVASTTITSMQGFYDDDGPNGSGPALLFQVNGGAYGAGQTPVVGADQLLGIVGRATGVTQVTLVLDTGVGGGPCRLRRWVIQGEGTKPTNLP